MSIPKQFETIFAASWQLSHTSESIIQFAYFKILFFPYFTKINLKGARKSVNKISNVKPQ